MDKSEKRNRNQNKGGRPEKNPEERRNTMLRVMVNKDEKGKIEEIMTKFGEREFSPFVRNRIFEFGKKNTTKVEFASEYLRQLGKIGNNINQIAYRLNSQSSNHLKADDIKTLDEIKCLLNELADKII
jgi:RNA processing factor Prp31